CESDYNEVNEDNCDDNNGTWNGFRIIGDNLDKNVKPRYRRIDHGTDSLHFFHIYAVPLGVILKNENNLDDMIEILEEVIWKKFYDTKSFMDKGSMAQLRNLIDRRNISADSESDYNACDDFFTVVVECHIIAAAMQYLKMATINDQPSHSLLIGLAQLCVGED
uniref:Uncharacterized protein n=1 Tax=Amphimedon queenslandica TaxID=400682 RepID=A0A1X7SZV1_AMPQE